jgi:membrane protein DedA with SNARE-associated domain
MVSATVVSFLLEKIHHLPAAPVYLLVAALVFAETALFLGFVFPGETAVIVAGVVASQGRVNIGLLCVIVVVAAILGECVGYAIGARYGERLFSLPLVRKRRVAIESALEVLRQRGAVMPALAGLSKLSYRRFFIANAISALLWGVGYCLLGYFAGGALTQIENSAGWVGVAILVILIVVFVVLYRRRRKRNAARQSV